MIDAILGRQEVEISYLLGSSYSGKGVVTEAARSVPDFALDSIGPSRVVAVIHPANRPSRRVAVVSPSKARD